MRFAVLTHRTRNLGDDIQSLAAAQFLPRVDCYLDRDCLGRYARAPETFVILAGWFKHNPADWPPPPNLRPLFVGFHLHSPELLAPRFIPYYKRHEPIGCRDTATMHALRRLGVEAYFSGCITLTLGETFATDAERDGLVHVVDADVLAGPPARCVRATHEIDWRTPPKQRLVLARQAVERYARAGMVVTRRLHAYLPCLGLGTPVVCTRTRGKRFSGLDELDVAAAAESLSRTCREAVARCAAPETVAPAGVAPEPEGGRGTRRAGAWEALVVPPARQEPRPPAWQELRPPHWQEPRPPAWEDLDELYEDHILTHAESRTHRGRMDHPTRSGALHNSLCGDVVRLALRLDATGRIVEARFDGRGCVVSQAGAAILCTVIEGADVAMARALTPQRMLELVRVPLSPARRSCALLAHRCLQEILAAR